MTLKYLIEKEFKQMFRNPFMPRLYVMMPIMLMLVMPWVATLDVKDVNVAIVDNDRSNLSRELIDDISNSPYFIPCGYESTYDAALNKIEYGTADVILTIPSGFGDAMVNGASSSLEIAANTINSTKGSLGGNYLSQVISAFSAEHGKKGAAITPKVDIGYQYMFNPLLDFKRNMIPALMIMLFILLCGFLPALNIVGEKEKGTIEQINVTPVSRFSFIIAKLIPYWIIGLVLLTFCMIIAYLVYGLAPAGNILSIYFISFIFMVALTGLGLIVSNYSDTMQQATLVMFFLVMIFMLMSGLYTPLNSSPDWAQNISALTPPRYLVDAIRRIYLKGTSIMDMPLNVFALIGMALFFNAWAVLGYRKSK